MLAAFIALGHAHPLEAQQKGAQSESGIVITGVRPAVLDVYLACHSAAVDGSDVLRTFCRTMHAPSRPRELTASEQARWQDSVPTAQAILDAVHFADSTANLATTVRNDLARVTFGTDSFAPRDTNALLAIAHRVTSNPYLRVSLVGLASAAGTTVGNAVLARQRAAFVRAFLLEHGVLEAQITTASEGDSRAVALDQDRRKEDLEAFRRVDIRFTNTPPADHDVATTRGALSGGGAGSATATLLNGLTDYLISEALRAVEESALKKSIGKLCADVTVKPFITASCEAFSAANIAAYTPSIARLRAAIRQDLAAMPAHFANIVDQTSTGSGTPQKCALVTSSRFFVQLSEGGTPRDALVAATAPTSLCSQLAPRVAFARAFLAEMDNASIELIELRPVDGLTQDSVIDYVVKTAAVHASQQTRLTVVSDVSRFAAGLAEAQSAWREIAQEIKAARRDSTKASKGALLVSLVGSGTPALSELLSMLAPNADKVSAIGQDVREATASLVTGRYGEALSSIVVAAHDADVQVPFTKTLAFAADLAQSTSAEDVSGAMRRYNGTGQGVARKRSGRYVMVNGYAGVSGGFERSVGSWSGAGSLFLPVGVELGGAIGHGAITSVGVLVQAIDLGSLAAVRIGGADSVEKAPAPTLAAVWSPGAMLRFGLGDSRFVTGPGVSYVPIGRRVRNSGDWHDAVRVIWTFAVDVPFYPFSN